MIEIPPKFANGTPVNQEWRSLSEREQVLRQWRGTQGLADDVRQYGKWMREEAQSRIGHHYPRVTITPELAKGRLELKPLMGTALPVIAWIWARTVKSPSPAFRHVDVPLTTTFMLSTKAEKEVYIHPAYKDGECHFEVRVGPPPPEAKQGTKIARGANFRCIASSAPIDDKYIKAESMAGRMGSMLMAVVVDGPKGRAYLSPTSEQERAAFEARPSWSPNQAMNRDTSDLVSGRGYGFSTWADLFTARQLVALTTFIDMLDEVEARIHKDAVAAGLSDDATPLRSGGLGAKAYAEAIRVYLSFAIDRVADYGSSFATWRPKDNAMRSTLAGNNIPMAYDYAEGSPFAKSSAGFGESVAVVARAIEFLAPRCAGFAAQEAAQTQGMSNRRIVSTDPPYYNNIAYADLSDFFYVWLRHSLKSVFPDLFATVAVPKADELVASPHRHGGESNAEAFFLEGMTQAIHSIAVKSHPGVPTTIYYAYKQSETETEGGTGSTGWETFLEAVNRASLAVTGTWPVRTEGDNRQASHSANALASSIVLACRQRSADAETSSRRLFLRELNEVLPEALDEMTKGAGDGRASVAPVDLSQAMIGPGMAVFSKYSAVLEANGKPMRVGTALQLINRFLAEDDFDHDTQFCLGWFEQHGWKDGKFGDADTLARAKGTSVDGVKHAGVLFASAGVVRLRKWADYPTDWAPALEQRLPVWEVLHQLIRVFKTEGESSAGAIVAAVQGKLDATRQLAYRLYTLCERSGWSEDARAYNDIITGWIAIESVAAAVSLPKQATLFG